MTSHRISLGTAARRHRLGKVRLPVMLAFGVIMILPLSITAFRRPEISLAPDVDTFHQLVTTEQGHVALQLLADIADQRGGWRPAPGDETVFVPTMRLYVASTSAIDLPPEGCIRDRDPTAPRSPDCGRDFQYEQNLVRFGPETFARRLRDGTFAPRPHLDDMLSVYIEEVGHSWQEYCYETEGRCQGERTQLTTYFEGKQRANGWEYQIKMYILSLDGTWLTLSDSERAELKTAICTGYANPRYTVVSPYGPPPGWPNPTGWPTTAPTPEEFQAFCADY